MSNTNVKWVLDPTHSEIVFKVKHLMISNVKGEFRSFSGEVSGEDFTTSPIQLKIDTSSIFTNEDSRDAHLKGSDFFNVEEFPSIDFVSTSMKKMDGDTYQLQGNLSIKGATHPITLQAEFGGTGKDPWGNEKAAFSVGGKIKRSEWGLNWNAALEAGGVLVSDEVRIQAEIQLVKQVTA
jgi:polyisoprenoid-binding protein YceI